MNKLSDVVKKLLKVTKTAATMISVIAVLFVVLLVCGLLIIFFLYSFEPPLVFSTGLLIGCVLSAVKVILLEKSLNKVLDMDKENAKKYSGFQAMLRFLLTIAVLLGVVFFPSIIGLFGIIAGILTLQISSYLTNFLLRNVKPEDI